MVIVDRITGLLTQADRQVLLAGANAHVHHWRGSRSRLGGLAGNREHGNGDSEEGVFHSDGFWCVVQMPTRLEHPATKRGETKGILCFCKPSYDCSGKAVISGDIIASTQHVRIAIPA